MTTYERRRALMSCVQCGKKDERTILGKARCKECAKIANANSKYTYDLRKKQGRCVFCGKPADGRLCDKCRVIEREYTAEYKRRKKNDLS